jgi:hypothetical protein
LRNRLLDASRNPALPSRRIKPYGPEPERL